jgi:hypothetical protein
MRRIIFVIKIYSFLNLVYLNIGYKEFFVMEKKLKSHMKFLYYTFLNKIVNVFIVCIFLILFKLI